MNIQKPKYQKNHYIHIYKLEDQLVLRINKVLKSSEFYQKYEAEIIQVNQIRTIGRVLINIDKNDLVEPINVDEIIITKNRLKEVNKALNPYEFDYQKYLKKQGIFHQIRLKKEDFISLKSRYNTLKGLAFNFRGKINKELNRYNFSPEELAIINALLLGQRQDISDELFESYKNAGAIHILAVSGLHIGIILIFLNFLLKPIDRLNRGNVIKLIVIVSCLWTYAFIAGLSASVVRAVTMFTAIAIGIASNRPSSVKNGLIVSIFILLLINPLFLFDVGFQLSYTAVFSIVWIHPYFNNLWKPKFKIGNYFWQLLTVSFAAQLGILPLSLYYFHQFPGLFFISSLVIIPFLGLILGSGLIIIILALFQILPIILAEYYGILIKTMNDFVTLISQQEAFIFPNISFSFFLMISVYFLLITIFIWIYNNTTKNLAFVFIAIILIQMTLFIEKIHIQKTSEFIVFHQIKNSVLGIRRGHHMNVYHNLDSVDIINNRAIASYKISNANLKIQAKYPISNVIKLTSINLLVIDSFSIYHHVKLKPEIVILTQSPKINLERLIQELNPKIIISDGSNYVNHSRLWEKSCDHTNTKFYNTSINGAFVYQTTNDFKP